MFPSMGVSSGDSLWAAQAYWACHALNSTATTSNPQCKTPYEMWYGKVPPSPFPILKPGFVKRKRVDKLKPKAVPCYYIGPSPNRPRDSMRVMLRSGVMIDSRDVTWASVPPPSHVVAPKSGNGEGENISAGLRPEEVESGESEAEFEPAGSECEPTNVDAESDESEDEAPYVFPRGAPVQAPAAAPVDRAAQSPPLTPATAPEGRVASPATTSEGRSRHQRRGQPRVLLV